MVIAGSSLPYSAVVAQITMGLDLILHITRNNEGKRYIDEISAVLPSKNAEFNLHKLYENKGGDLLERICTEDDLEKYSGFKN